MFSVSLNIWLSILSNPSNLLSESFVVIGDIPSTLIFNVCSLVCWNLSSFLFYYFILTYSVLLDCFISVIFRWGKFSISYYLICHQSLTGGIIELKLMLVFWLHFCTEMLYGNLSTNRFCLHILVHICFRYYIIFYS